MQGRAGVDKGSGAERIEKYFGRMSFMLTILDDKISKKAIQMLQNNESYKRIDLTLVGFSMRLLNTARRNGLHTLYDLIESYNSGSFAKMRNIGKTTIQELENFDFSSVSAISGIQASAIDDITPVEETEEVIPIVWDDILPATYLDSGFEKNIFKRRLPNIHRRPGYNGRNYDARTEENGHCNQTS